MEIALGLNTVIGVMAQVSKRWQLGRLAGTTADESFKSLEIGCTCESHQIQSVANVKCRTVQLIKVVTRQLKIPAVVKRVLQIGLGYRNK